MAKMANFDCFSGVAERRGSKLEMLMNYLLHITRYEDWTRAVGEGVYRPDSLREEGFIHCSTRSQIIGVANRAFGSEQGLVLLCIDGDLLEAEVRYEDCYDSGQQFPHIYGPLPVGAVVRVLPFSPGADGRFALPRALATDAAEEM